MRAENLRAYIFLQDQNKRLLQINKNLNEKCEKLEYLNFEIISNQDFKNYQENPEHNVSVT